MPDDDAPKDSLFNHGKLPRSTWLKIVCFTFGTVSFIIAGDFFLYATRPFTLERIFWGIGCPIVVVFTHQYSAKQMFLRKKKGKGDGKE